MVEHYASVTVKAPLHQVYTLFTHFNDFPKFMRFVKEVTYLDDQRSHWAVQVLGHHEWDAVNEDWIPDRQVGWRSTNGLHNSGKVKFRSTGPESTIIDVYIHYVVPTGPLGKIGEKFGVVSYFESILQEDLRHFARMVEEAPPGSLDPMSSHYLFHEKSAVGRGEATERQKVAMAQDPMMSAQALAERKARIEKEAARNRQEQLAREEELRRRVEIERRAQEEHQALLAREAEKRQQEKALLVELVEETRRDPHPVYDTLGGRSAALDRTAMGDRDGSFARYPKHEQDPMTARHPRKEPNVTKELSSEEKLESPWLNSIRGTRPPSESET